MSKRFVLIFVLVLSMVCTASAGIVYVDATDGEAGNTALATGEIFAPVDVGTGGSGEDGLWRIRAFANSGTIYESGGSWEADLNTEDCPRLMTTVDVPEGNYDVYVYFWADAAQWRIQAALEDSEGDLPLFIANDPNGGATMAAAADFEEPIPLLTEDNRTLWQAYIGTSGVTSAITVFIDDEAAHMTGNSRTWYDGIGYASTAPVYPVSLGAAGDITLDNGPRYGQDGSGNGSGLEARDIPDRRHVFMLSYDISDLKDRGPISNVSLSNFSHDQHGEVNVYGIIEDLDLLDVESLTWNTAPGLKNDPAPELNSTVTTALDMNDLTDVLLTFSGPGETGVRFSTDTSDALTDFINSDTDGIITLLVVPAAEGNQLIVRSREHSAGGSLLEGEVTTPPPPAAIPVENASFELPGTEKIKGWNGEGVAGTPAEDIPGWSSDTEVADSGVETGWNATDGEWTAFLMGGDPSVWQLTSFVIGADDVIELKVDAANNWQATTLQMSLYIDDNGARVTVAVADCELAGEMQEFSMVLNAADAPDAVGGQLGIEFNNVTEASDSWIGMDNVRLQVQ